ncbi:hypothetical protein MLD38_027336 [Melastoma candidum]|uniref:Uncharacterized protein n=1 Tax=Melastoma candidum TaxID=119954 RepID=A0ACB9P618_9MYRT|nr:hypothetical protein MLD38_027336 [Melastoma candidum]
MGKKDASAKMTRAEAVLRQLRKQSPPLTFNQEKFCDEACIERFLKSRGDNVNKAAKQLKACLSWRQSIGIETLIADEFSAELMEGIAYVAGHDDESRPVLILRVKQDYHKFHSQKLFNRLLVFTLEVAIGTMPKNVDQFVLLMDASFYRSASAFMNLLISTMKIMGDYYPGRLHEAFVVDPPSMFSYLWKGVKPFVELSSATSVVSSLDFQDALDFKDFASYPTRGSSLRFDPSSVKSTAKVGSCSSSRFSFTVSHNFNSLKPWHLTLTDTPPSKADPTSPFSIGLSPGLVSPLNARSLSFALPAARGGGYAGIGGSYYARNPRVGLFPSKALPQRVTARSNHVVKAARNPRTPGSCFLQSPATFFGTRRESYIGGRSERSRESFAPFVKFYRRPYDEMVYRSKMRPPLGGLISIVSPHIRRQHVSASQRF